MNTAGTRLSRLVLAVAIVVVLIAGVAVVGSRQGRDAHDGNGAAAPKAPGATDEALRTALPELEAFVEQTRGLKFLRPPKVELLTDDRFDALLREDDGSGDVPGAAEQAAYIGLLRALGLVTGEVDLDAVADDTIADVVGFYDTHTKVLYARGVELTAYVKEVLVHELTHALDDQHFGLDRPDLTDDETSTAYDVLVEGSAMVVEGRWYDARPPAEQEAIDAEEGGGGGDEGGGGGSDVFEQLFSFPYEVGPPFVQALLDAGGPPRLDEAFRHPPVTTEQAIHPERFLAGEGAKPVAAPAADGAVVDEGSLGELGLVLVLDSAVSHAAALRAGNGWGGDRYVAWTSRGRTCVRWSVVMDTAKDGAEALTGLRSWAAKHPDATVTGTSPIVVTNCA